MITLVSSERDICNYYFITKLLKNMIEMSILNTSNTSRYVVQAGKIAS